MISSWPRRRTPGFSLIELTIGLGLSVFLVITSLEVIARARSVFLSFKTEQEISQAADAALSRISADARSAGKGLVQPARLGALSVLSAGENTLEITSAEAVFDFRSDVEAGDTRIFLSRRGGLKPGHRICLQGPDGAEIRTVASVDGSSCLVSIPYIYGYPRHLSRAVHLKDISYYLERRTGILRREVNLGAAQPLSEGIFSFEVHYDPLSNLLTVRLTQESRKDVVHELKVFPNNIGLSGR